MYCLLGVPRLIAEPLGLAPGPSSNTRDSAQITPLPLIPFHLGIGLTRRFELPLSLFPLPLYDALGTHLRRDTVIPPMVSGL